MELETSTSIWSKMNLFHLAGLMLIVGIIFRIIDVFYLDLGSTWFNVMPSKIIPLLFMLLIFHVYRRREVSSVLGLSKNRLTRNLLLGMLMGVFLYTFIEIGAILVYGTFIDPTYPFEFHVTNPELLWYQFLFFFTNAVLEETLFRGILQNGFRTRLPLNHSVLLSAIAFSLWHICWPIINGIPDVFALSQVIAMLSFGVVFGCLMGLYYEKFTHRTSLIGPIIAHTLGNFFNECFPIGIEPTIDGPDMVYSTPSLMAISTMLFIIAMTFLFFIIQRYKISQLDSLEERIVSKLRNSPALLISLAISLFAAFWVILMQVFSDILFSSAVIAITISIIMGLHLLRIWYNQEQRIITDLPLMFGIVFLAQTMNHILRISQSLNFVDTSIAMFRLRSFFVMASIFPLIAILLHIWLPRIKRHHPKTMIVSITYWIAVTLLGPTESLIMMLLLPLLLVTTFGLIFTFAITWKTGRLKEIRSDLMVLSLILGAVCQFVATDLLVNAVLNMVTTVIATLALVNPWKAKKEIIPKEEYVAAPITV